MAILNSIVTGVDNIQKQLIEIRREDTQMAVDLTALTSAVAAIEKAVNDGLAEITTLATQITNTVDPAALAALAARITTVAATMEAGVAAASAPPATPPTS